MQPGMQRACMTETEACEDCGIVDALDRHDPMCPRALRLGLLRLAEGEAPIDPSDSEEPLVEYDEEPGAVALANLHEAVADRPGAIERAPDLQAPYRTSDLTELWFSYAEVDGSFDDAVVFGSELDALRHAVTHGAKVRRLELGKSLRAQADAP